MNRLINLFENLEPKLIAPVVAYLCHESSEENGSIIESAAGWATKVRDLSQTHFLKGKKTIITSSSQVHTVRGKGAVLRTSISDDVTPENVRDAWSKVVDMSQAEHLGSITEATGSLVEILDSLTNNGDSNTTQSGSVAAEDTFSFNYKDLILYALGGR